MKEDDISDLENAIWALLDPFHKKLLNKFTDFLEKSEIRIDEQTIDSIDFKDVFSIYAFHVNKHVSKQSLTTLLTSNEKLIYKIFRLDNEIKNVYIDRVEITINKSLDVQEIQLVLTIGKQSNQNSKNLLIIIDNFMQANYLSFTDTINKKHIVKTKNLMSLNDEIFLFKFLHIIDDSIINQIIPEIKMVGVYDYNSNDFKKRIEYCELLDY